MVGGKDYMVKCALVEVTSSAHQQPTMMEGSRC